MPSLPEKKIGLSIAKVLGDWGISNHAHPLHLPVTRILEGGSKTSGARGLFELKAVRALLGNILKDTISGESLKWGPSPQKIKADGVAEAFSLPKNLWSAIVELKFAAHLSNRESSKGHVEVALARVEAEISEREGMRLPFVSDGPVAKLAAFEGQEF